MFLLYLFLDKHASLDNIKLTINFSINENTTLYAENK